MPKGCSFDKVERKQVSYELFLNVAMVDLNAYFDLSMILGSLTYCNGQPFPLPALYSACYYEATSLLFDDDDEVEWG